VRGSISSSARLTHRSLRMRICIDANSSLPTDNSLAPATGTASILGRSVPLWGCSFWFAGQSGRAALLEEPACEQVARTLLKTNASRKFQNQHLSGSQPQSAIYEKVSLRFNRSRGGFVTAQPEHWYGYHHAYWHRSWHGGYWYGGFWHPGYWYPGPVVVVAPY